MLFEFIRGEKSFFILIHIELAFAFPNPDFVIEVIVVRPLYFDIVFEEHLFQTVFAAKDFDGLLTTFLL